MNKPKVGDQVEATLRGTVFSHGAHGVYIHLTDGPEAGLRTYAYFEDCTVIAPSPQAGETWKREDGMMVFFYFDASDRLCGISAHGGHWSVESIMNGTGWTKVHP